MLRSSGEVEKLFNKNLLVTIKDGSISRKLHLTVAIENQMITVPLLRKELVVRLTDESDPFFLYTLSLNDDDFQSLKSQQGLLVDFPAFPKKFIDLLELCFQEEHKEMPRFLLTLSLPDRSGMDVSPAYFDIIETNPFKHLTHLSLKLLPASDTNLKKYLGTCLKVSKDEKEKLETRLRITETDLQQRLLHVQEALSSRNQELERTKAEFKAEQAERDRKHADEMSTERERLMKAHREEEQRWEKERKEYEQSNYFKMQKLENRASCLDSLNRELQEKQYKNDTSNKELRNRVITLEDEIHQLHQKLQKMNKENSALDSECQEQGRIISHLKNEISVSEEQNKVLKQDINRLHDHVTSIQEQKQKLEEECDRKQAEIKEQSSSINGLSAELRKGHDIIRKFQVEMQNSQTKLKLHGKITMKQEKILVDKEEELQKLKEELSNTKESFKEKELENSKLTASLGETKQKLEECQKQIKTNENVIKWLNKQLNEVQTNAQRMPVNVESASTIVPLRQNTYQPLTTVTMTRMATSLGRAASSVPNYLQSQLTVNQKTVNPNLRIPAYSTTDNILSSRIITTGASRNVLPSMYFQQQGDKAPFSSSAPLYTVASSSASNIRSEETKTSGSRPPLQTVPKISATLRQELPQTTLPSFRTELKTT